MIDVEFPAEVRRYTTEKSSWYFAALPVDLSADIRGWTSGSRGGWGSVKVQARIGSTSWSTSIFPDSASGAFLLPVKAEVRKREGIDHGDSVHVLLQISA